MDGHALLGDIAVHASLIFDGGPRGFRRRGKRLPEKYLPERFLADSAPDERASVVRAVNATKMAAPAPWFLRYVVDEEEPRSTMPPLPVDRRWCRHGRWSTP